MSFVRNPYLHTSPLVKYLEEPSVQVTLHENILTFLTPSAIQANGLSYISRCFNNFSPVYHPALLLLTCVDEAIATNHLSTWVDLAFAYGLDDLFDKDGNVLAEIADSLNYQDTFAKLWKVFDKQVECEEIKAQLLSAYFGELISAPAYKRVVIHLPDCSTRPEDMPIVLYSRYTNARQNELHCVDETFIRVINNKLRTVAKNTAFTAPHLRTLIIERFELLDFMNARIELTRTLGSKLTHESLSAFGAHVLFEVDELATGMSKSIISHKLLIDILEATKTFLEDPCEYNADAIENIITDISVTTWGNKFSASIKAMGQYTELLGKGLAVVRNNLEKPLNYLPPSVSGFAYNSISSGIYSILKFGFSFFQQANAEASPVQRELALLTHTAKRKS